MSDLSRFSDPVWEKFFDFTFGCDCDEKLSREEIQNDLKRFGIDVRAAVAKVKQEVEVAKAKAELIEAKTQRSSILATLKHMTVASGKELRDNIRWLIEHKLQGNSQLAYFSKLETAASDADLQSLLEDIHNLEMIMGDKGDGVTGTG